MIRSLMAIRSRARASSRSPVRREGHVPSGPDEQPRAQLILEASDVAADRLLGDEQPGGRPREAQLLGDGDEVAQGTDIDVDVPDRSDRTHAVQMLVRSDRVLDATSVAVERRRWQQAIQTPPHRRHHHDRPRSPRDPADRTRPRPGRARLHPAGRRPPDPSARVETAVWLADWPRRSGGSQTSSNPRSGRGTSASRASGGLGLLPRGRPPRDQAGVAPSRVSSASISASRRVCRPHSRPAGYQCGRSWRRIAGWSVPSSWRAWSRASARRGGS